MSMYVCYCLQKSGSGSLSMVRRLGGLQEYFEKSGAPDLPQQAFVYGDGEAEGLSFRAYPRGWRSKVDAGMAQCRPQDMLALSWRLLESAMRRQPESDFKLVILADRPAGTEEECTQLLKDRLQELKEKGLEVIFVCCSPDADSGFLRTLVSTEIGAGEDIAFVLGGS